MGSSDDLQSSRNEFDSHKVHHPVVCISVYMSDYEKFSDPKFINGSPVQPGQWFRLSPSLRKELRRYTGKHVGDGEFAKVISSGSNFNGWPVIACANYCKATDCWVRWSVYIVGDWKSITPITDPELIAMLELSYVHN